MSDALLMPNIRLVVKFRVGTKSFYWGVKYAGCEKIALEDKDINRPTIEYDPSNKANTDNLQ